DDDVLVFGGDLFADAVAITGLVLLTQEVHGIVNAAQFSARYRQVARVFGSASQHDSVELRLQRFRGACVQAVFGIFGGAHVGGWAEFHTFGFHLGKSAVDVGLFQFEVGNAVAQQAADAIAFLEYGNGMPRAGQLLRAGQPGRPGADNGHFLAGFARWRLRNHPALLPAFVDNGVFDGLDANRVIVDVQGTGRFAGSGAYASGEFRKVVGGMQYIERAAPVLPINQIIPVGNDIVDRAAAGAERYAAIHTPRALLLCFGVGQGVN